MAADPADAQHAPRDGLHRLDDGQGLALWVAEQGATWCSCRVPLADGRSREVLVGRPPCPARVDSDHADEADPAYRGHIVGRVANRIAGARFALDGRSWALPANEGHNHLHGGPEGFHRRRWTLRTATRRRLLLELVSPAGDQGYPGDLHVELEYRIDAPGQVTIAWQARCNAPCPVNLSAHAYFNLDDPQADLRGHRLSVAADQVLPVDTSGIPTGEMAPVHGSAFDLRRPAPALGPQGAGFDHCWVLQAKCADARQPAALLHSADGELALELRTTLPGLQVYTGANLVGLAGREGQPLAADAGVALEPQYFPDFVNRPAWHRPGCVLRPGERVEHRIEYRFLSPAPA